MEQTKTITTTMKQIRTSTLLLLAALLLAACTQEEMAELPGSGTDTERVEITPSATVAGSVEVSGRAPIDETAANTFYFKRADETTSGTYGAYASTDFTATRTAGAGAQGLTFAPLQYYPANGLKSKIIGYYPAATATNTTQVQWTLNGTQDVMTAPRQEGNKANKTITAFTFTHRLAQLRFYPYATAQDVSNQWGRIAKIEVLAQPSGISYLMANDAMGNITATSGTAVFTVAGISNAAMPVAANAAAATTQVGASTMVLPQADANYELQIKITTENKGEVTVTRKGALAAATPYKINLRFWGKGVDVEAMALTVADWGTGAAKPDAPAAKTYPYVMNGKIIVSKDADGQGVNEIHPNWADGTVRYTQNDAVARQVSARFEVANDDAGAGVMNGFDAQNICTAPWRLPTFNEFHAIRQMNSTLGAIVALSGYRYWVGVRYYSNPNHVCAITFSDGAEITPANEKYSYNVRCIRDVN